MAKVSGVHTPVLLSTIRRFTSGSGNYNLSYAFIVSNANATVGATYTNNGVTFTIYATVSGAALLYASGSGAPAITGTLTKSAGTGDTTIVFSSFIAAKYLKVTVLGAGGSGAGGGNNDAGSGSTGNTSTFGSSLIAAVGGTGGSGAFVGGPGGGFSINTPAIDIGSSAGEAGGSVIAIFGNYVNSIFPGAHGGGGGLGGGGGPGGEVSAGSNGVVNTGGGGGGGGVTGFASGYTAAGTGGGGGGVARALITSPATTYSYNVAPAQTTVGAAGSGTSGAGGQGGSGLVVVEEFYA